VIQDHVVCMYSRDPYSVDQLSTLSFGFHTVGTADTDLDDAQLGSLGHERCESPSRIPVGEIVFEPR
jgi:hypothetical protein